MTRVDTPAAERDIIVGDTADAVEATGHFRIYLGAAAGVGKTYAMLNEATGARSGAPTSSSGSSSVTAGG